MTDASQEQRGPAAAGGNRASLLSVVLGLGMVVVAAGTMRLSGAATARAFLWGSILSAFVQLVVAVHLRLLRREREEELDRRALAARSKEKDTALFESETTDLFSAARARRQFERFAVPAAAVLLTAGMAAAAWMILRRPAAVPSGTTLPSALALAAAAVCFILGRYLAALSKDPALRPLRAAGGQWLFVSVLAAAAAAAAAAAGPAVGIPGADRWIALGAGILFAVLAVESFITLILEPYRPRIEGEEFRPLYESRMLDLLAQPTGVIRTAAEALDYQFGFRVSETWFYRFIARAFVPLLLFQLVTLYLLSCIVYVAPDEVALLERFGRRVPGREILDSGLHLKWPWPFERAWRYPAKKVLVADVGIDEKEQEKEHEEKGRRKIILWTEAHGHGHRPYVVASREGGIGAEGDRQTRFVPVNLLSVHALLQYRIRDVNRFAYDFADGEDVVRAIASQAMAMRLITVDFQQFLTEEFGAVAEEVRRRIQERCDELGLGVEILFFAFENAHPPVPVAVAFEKVFAAQQAEEADVFRAEAYREKLIPDAEAGAERTLREAQADAFRMTNLADATAERYLDRLKAYRAAPEVYRMRSYLSVLRRGLEKTRKIVVAALGSEVFVLDLQQKIRPDLLDVPLQSPSSGEGS